jgi:hypothetical protein
MYFVLRLGWPQSFFGGDISEDDFHNGGEEAVNGE